MLHPDVRLRLEEEEESLSPFAIRSRSTRGRQRPEEPSLVRTEFQRDRDRIIHSMSFRRLKYKTQVFIAPPGDHYVTRLTHTLEVGQIARTIARALNLNEDLTEAISLAHDLGHTPFGHAGEEALAGLLPGGFRHNEQSLRVVDLLEKGGQGLNLTWEVREGILLHSKVREDILAEGWGTASTLEGRICKIADSVAYINHDIGDAIRAGMLTEDDLPRDAAAVLGQRHSKRIDTLVCDIIDSSWAATGEGDGDPVITMSSPVRDAANTLREFLFQEVYFSPASRSKRDEAVGMVQMLYRHFLDHPESLPAELKRSAEESDRSVADYVAGMTDRYAVELYQDLKGRRTQAPL
ncbi:MAG: deoxyguanosinetriphosphate triphosphohydrolase [Dehalococcoidia bacterium]|nr:deoxyguanosinetriphosphate triphosphohydrolase [Dehalococcoidia bacterium]